MRRLRSEILSGALIPGERLVEEQLTRRLGISRASLREALRLLGQQGLVELPAAPGRAGHPALGLATTSPRTRALTDSGCRLNHCAMIRPAGGTRGDVQSVAASSRPPSPGPGSGQTGPRAPCASARL
ncbi:MULTISPECIES: GntR family transcriptional regulator [unclassified Pseudonocardia]|uniref:GntR family transcriptional regulator n=1 Tax=unclassified Pseudonocardia TaxID=2619320 RepID=UPI0025E0E66F|nr:MULTISPECIES: GntR family transcriptional regulator [unclassified Pseudonocardia]